MQKYDIFLDFNLTGFFYKINLNKCGSQHKATKIKKPIEILLNGIFLVSLLDVVCSGFVNSLLLSCSVLKSL